MEKMIAKTELTIGRVEEENEIFCFELAKCATN